jgi:hypothetical protein
MSFIIKNINRFFKYLDFLFYPKPDKYRPKNTLQCNGQFTNLIIPLEEFQNSGRKVFRLSMNFRYHLTVVPPFNSSI